jgi:adenylosuccinate lyase
MPAGFNLQQAVPITFGFKMARLLTTLQRRRIRLAEIRPRIEVFEFGGAAGTLATLRFGGAKLPDQRPSPASSKLRFQTYGVASAA